MCFSATASFTAGVALLAVGAVTARRASGAFEMPFALIPVLFGIQQLIEGALWMTLSGASPHWLPVLTHVYSIFSHVLWPIYVPIAVLLLESVAWRRKILAGIALAGTTVGLYLLYFLVTQPIIAQVSESHIGYVSPHFYVGAVMALYLLATCISSLFSSHSKVRWFGVATFVSFVAAYAIYAAWFISVWCFFAAVISGIVLLHFPRRRDEDARAELRRSA